MGKMRNAYKTLVGQPERKSLLVRPRKRWKDNIKMDLRETGLESDDWLAQKREQWQAHVNTVILRASHEGLCSMKLGLCGNYLFSIFDKK
jgi:hypothetical protein